MGRAGQALVCAIVLAGCTSVPQEKLRDYSEEGMILYGQGDFRHAGECFQAALTLKPNDAALLLQRGHCYDRIDKTDLAEKYYVACLTQDRISPVPSCLPGVAHRTGRKTRRFNRCRPGLPRRSACLRLRRQKAG